MQFQLQVTGNNTINCNQMTKGSDGYVQQRQVANRKVKCSLTLVMLRNINSNRPRKLLQVLNPRLHHSSEKSVDITEQQRIKFLFIW